MIAKALYSRGLQSSIVNLKNIQQIILEDRCDRPLLIHLYPDKTLLQSLSFSKWTWLTTTTWLIFTSSASWVEPTLEKMDQIPRAINPRILVAHLNDSSIEEWWRMTKIRGWERETWSLRGYLPGQRNQLRGITFRIGCGLTSTFTKMHYFQNHTIKYISRQFGRILYVLQEFLQFEIKYVISEELGDLNRNKNSTGLLNRLVQNEIDFAAYSVIRTSKRMKAFHYLYDLNSARLSVFLKKPNELEMGWRDYLGIFDRGMWICMFVTVIITALLDGLFFWLLKDNHVACRTNWDPTESLLLMLGSVCCTQSQSRIPDSYSGRVVLLTVCFLSLVTTNSFNGFLTALVAIERFELPFKNLEDLAKDKNYALGMTYPSTTYEIFQNSENHIFQRLFEGPMKHPNAYFVNSSRKGMKEICLREKLAFITYDFLIWDMETDCELTMLPEQILYLSTSMAVPYNSIYLRYFNELIRFAQENGVFKKLIRKRLKSIINEEIKFDSVYLEDVYFQFTILLSGQILALLIFSFEILLQKYLCKKRKILIYNE